MAAWRVTAVFFRSPEETGQYLCQTVALQGRGSAGSLERDRPSKSKTFSHLEQAEENPSGCRQSLNMNFQADVQH
jgi:hypothetical protein